MLLQLGITPVFLSFWGATQFGEWLLLLAALGMTQIVAASHQYFVGFEIMRIGEKRPRFYSRMTRTGFHGGAFITVLQLAVLVVIATLTYRTDSSSVPIFTETGWALLIMGVGQFPATNWAGIWERVVVQQGGYERSCWWGIVSAVSVGLSPLLVIFRGGGILAVACVYAGFTFVVMSAAGLDLRRIGRAALRAGVTANRTLLFSNLMRSQWLIVKTLLEGFRQQGVRLLISPLAGPAGLAAFSTMRTGANVALQGLGTITSPIMPELMRFLNRCDQARCEAAFGAVWMALVAGMCPAVLILQVVIAPLFEIWTLGKIPFDPYLFVTLSIGILVYTFSQPAVAIVQGNNLLRVQVWITSLAAAVALGGILLLVPSLNLLGAGVALLAAEVVAAGGYVVVAATWMRSRGMRWPRAAASSVAASVGVSSIAMVLVAALPAAAVWVAGFGLLAQIATACLYWKELPELARGHVSEVIAARIPVSIKRRFVRS